jgi:hypothetical protein
MFPHQGPQACIGHDRRLLKPLAEATRNPVLGAISRVVAAADGRVGPAQVVEAADEVPGAAATLARGEA